MNLLFVYLIELLNILEWNQISSLQRLRLNLTSSKCVIDGRLHVVETDLLRGEKGLEAKVVKSILCLDVGL